MKPYQVGVAPAATKELEKLSKKVVDRIIEAIERLADNPRPRGSLKLQGADDLYRIRVGVYRIIYEIRDQQLLVLIVRIRHRKNAY